MLKIKGEGCGPVPSFGDVHFWVLLETALQGGVFDKSVFYRLWRCALFGTFGNCLTGGGYLTSGRFDACGDVHFLLLLETALQGGYLTSGRFTACGDIP